VYVRGDEVFGTQGGIAREEVGGHTHWVVLLVFPPVNEDAEGVELITIHPQVSALTVGEYEQGQQQYCDGAQTIHAVEIFLAHSHSSSFLAFFFAAFSAAFASFSACFAAAAASFSACCFAFSAALACS